MSKEKLIPVKSEAELRVGMIAVTMPCKNCGMQHRYMLLKRSENPDCWLVSDPDIRGHGWKRAPEPACSPGLFLLAFLTIDQGRLFRVEDGLDLEKERAADKELERVR